MAWAKLYTAIYADPKLMRAARQGHDGLYLLPWLIVFAKLADDAGRLSVAGEPAEAVDVAAGIPGVTPETVAAALAGLEAIGVLVRDPDEVLRFLRWETRQTKPSDSNEAWRERQKRSRDRRKSSKNATGHALSREGVTRDNRDMSRPVTPPCHAIEKRNPTGFLGKTRGSGAPALAHAARGTESVDLVEPTPEERARAKALADEFRAMEDAG